MVRFHTFYFNYLNLICGYNSVVEYLVANETVVGSNPTTRSTSQARKGKCRVETYSVSESRSRFKSCPIMDGSSVIPGSTQITDSYLAQQWAVVRIHRHPPILKDTFRKPKKLFYEKSQKGILIIFQLFRLVRVNSCI